MNYLDDLYLWLVAMVIAFGLCAAGAGLERLLHWWQNRQLLPPPDDPRLRNLVSLRDWKSRSESASKLLRKAA